MDQVIHCLSSSCVLLQLMSSVLKIDILAIIVAHLPREIYSSSVARKLICPWQIFCDLQRLRSTCVAMQSVQSIRIPHDDIIGFLLYEIGDFYTYRMYSLIYISTGWRNPKTNLIATWRLFYVILPISPRKDSLSEANTIPCHRKK